MHIANGLVLGVLGVEREGVGFTRVSEILAKRDIAAEGFRIRVYAFFGRARARVESETGLLRTALAWDSWPIAGVPGGCDSHWAG